MTGSFDCAGCGVRCGWPPDGADVPMCRGCRPRRDAVADPAGDIECCNCGARIWSGDMGRDGYCYCAHCAWGVKRPPEEFARYEAAGFPGSITEYARTMPEIRELPGDDDR